MPVAQDRLEDPAGGCVTPRDDKAPATAALACEVAAHSAVKAVQAASSVVSPSLSLRSPSLDPGGASPMGSSSDSVLPPRSTIMARMRSRSRRSRAFSASRSRHCSSPISSPQPRGPPLGPRFRAASKTHGILRLIQHSPAEYPGERGVTGRVFNSQACGGNVVHYSQGEFPEHFRLDCLQPSQAIVTRFLPQTNSHDLSP